MLFNIQAREPKYYKPNYDLQSNKSNYNLQSSKSNWDLQSIESNPKLKSKESNYNNQVSQNTRVATIIFCPGMHGMYFRACNSKANSLFNCLKSDLTLARLIDYNFIRACACKIK